jgi:hypothetical protein
MFHFRRVLFIIADVVALTLAAATHAVLAQTAGQIYGCVAASSGSLRIVDATTRCKSNEYSVTWQLRRPLSLIEGDENERRSLPTIYYEI